MGLGTWLASVWGTGKTPAQLQAESDEADRQLAALNSARRDRKAAEADYLEDAGYIDEAEQTRRDSDEWQRIASMHLDSGRVDVQHELDTAFDEGTEEGKRNVAGFFGSIGRTIQDVLNSLTGGLARLIPWQVWVALLAVGLFYAWPFISRALKRRAAA